MLMRACSSSKTLNAGTWLPLTVTHCLRTVPNAIFNMTIHDRRAIRVEARKYIFINTRSTAEELAPW